MRIATLERDDTPSSTRIAVDRAVALSKERNPKWEGEEPSSPVIEKETPQHPIVARRMNCSKVASIGQQRPS